MKFKTFQVVEGAMSGFRSVNEAILDVWWRVMLFMDKEWQGPNAPDGLSTSHLRLMRAVRDQPLSMMAIANVLGVSRVTATSMVDRLLAKKFIQRAQYPSDRRSMRVWLTPKGRAFMDRMHERAIQRSELLTNLLTSEERESLRKTLMSLGNIVERQSGTADPRRLHIKEERDSRRAT